MRPGYLEGVGTATSFKRFVVESSVAHVKCVLVYGPDCVHDLAERAPCFKQTLEPMTIALGSKPEGVTMVEVDATANLDPGKN